MSYSTSLQVNSTSGYSEWFTKSPAPGLSPSGQARIYFDGTNLKVSENGGAYVNLVGGGGGTTYPVAPSGGSYTTSATGANSVALGDAASAAGDNSTVLGQGAADNTHISVTIVGQGSSASNDYATVLGASSTSGYNSVVVGPFSTAVDNAVVIGANASVSSSNGVAIGQGASAGSALGDDFAVAVGHFASVAGYNNCALGGSASAQGNYTSAIGNDAAVNPGAVYGHCFVGATVSTEGTVQNYNFVVVGSGATIPQNNLAAFSLPAYGSNVFCAGGSGSPLADVFFGAGVKAINPVDVTIHGTQGINSAAVSNPTLAPTTAVLGGGGTFAAGTYAVAYAWSDLLGETLISPLGSVTTTGTDAITITAPNSGGTVETHFYCEDTPGSGNLFYVGKAKGVPGVVQPSIEVDNPPTGTEAPAPVSNTTAHNGDGGKLNLAGGLGAINTNTGGDISFFTGRSGSGDSLTRAGWVDAATGTLSWEDSGANSQRFGLNSSAAGNNSLAVGNSANAVATGATALGYNSVSYLTNCVTVGPNNQAGENGAAGGGFNICIGNNNQSGVGSTGSPTDNICIGDTCLAGVGTNAANGENIAVGETAIAGASTATSSFQYQANIALGLQNWSGGDNGRHHDCITLGEVCRAGSDQAVTARDLIAIGDGSTAQGLHDNICIGDGCSVFDGNSVHDCIAVGDFSSCANSNTDHDLIAIGNSAIVYGQRNIAIGFGPTIAATTTAHDTICLGAATADYNGSFTQSNAFIAGASGFAITDVWFGSGMNSGGSAPSTWSLRGSENWGSVTNKNGGQLNIVGGRGWDGGTGGEVHIRTSNVAGAGVIGTEQDVIVADRLGNAQVGLGGLLAAATDGFVYIPSITGPPVGTPTTKTGWSPMSFDPSTNKLWIYNGTSWVSTTLA
jgi:hypothetical protein